MSDSPLGPWEYKGHIMDHTPKTRGNHPGIIDYKGKSYVFGLNYDILRLSTPDHERRSVSAAEMTYAPDGTIMELPYFSENVVKQIEPFNPFRRVEAETMAWGYGLKTAPLGNRNMYVHDIDNGEHIMIKGVDFGKKGAKSIEISASSVKPGAEVELRAGDKVIGTVKIEPTGNLDTYRLHTAKLLPVSGTHDLYLYFKGEGNDLFRMDYWKMK